jgi:hypothetical protein
MSLCSLILLDLTPPCKISKQNLADMLQDTKKSEGESLCKHRNFPANKMIDKKQFYDLSNTKTRAENHMK